MAQCWYWGLLLCQLAAWASAAPVNADKSQEKAANRQEFSSHHTQLTDSTQGASGTAKHSADPKSLPIIQNDQPQAPQEDSGKSKGTENSSTNSHSGGAESTKTEKDTDKSREGQTGISDTPSVPEPKTKDSKQEADPSIKTPNAKSDGSAQDSRKIDSVQTKNIQENPDDLEESETDASHPDLNVKKVQLSKDLEPKDQNLPVQKPTSTKEDSSEVTNAQEDTSFPKPKTKDSKQKEDPSIKDVNISDAQDPSSNLNPVQAKNKKTNTDISDANFSDQEVNDESKPMEDASAKDQDPQSDLSGKHLQKSNPVESPKAEEEVVDPKDEPKKGLGDEKKKSAKHEEDSEGTPKNGSENSHFFAYLVTTAIVVAALYIAYHNKRKIIAFALEGKKAKTARRPKSSDYQRLDQKI